MLICNIFSRYIIPGSEVTFYIYDSNGDFPTLHLHLLLFQQSEGGGDSILEDPTTPPIAEDGEDGEELMLLQQIQTLQQEK